MKVLCTHAGRFGDLLWSLPAARAVAETIGEPVDFCISKAYGSIAALVRQQDYIREAWGDDTWEILETAPITPAQPPEPLVAKGGYDTVFHLSFGGWPTAQSLAAGYWIAANQRANDLGLGPLKKLDTGRPWISAGDHTQGSYIYVGFTNNWIELKAGVLFALALQMPEQEFVVPCSSDSRWLTEWDLPGKPRNLTFKRADWVETAQVMAGAKFYFGCNSSQWVLANAIGKRVMMMEPMEARWNPVFFLESKRNRMVMGGDGRPTFDARACVQQVKAVLEEGE